MGEYKKALKDFLRANYGDAVADEYNAAINALDVDQLVKDKINAALIGYLKNAIVHGTEDAVVRAAAVVNHKVIGDVVYRELTGKYE